MKNLFFLFVALIFISKAHTQNVGIGTNTPNNSAQLDVTSTTKGLLPPRMTALQRDGIASPAQGLMIYCTNCGANGQAQYYDGTAWVNMIGGTTAAILVIGASYQGGKIFYILQSGDPGYIAGQVHGLIAAISDQSTGIQWYNGTYIITGANATGYGEGNANTNTIVSAQGAGGYAAQLCADLVLNGYSDWYLPSSGELNQLYLNRVAVTNFGPNYYWSSSEVNATTAWLQYFFDGLRTNVTKSGAIHVRAVRSF